MPLKFECGVMKVGNSIVMVLPKSLCDNFGIKEKTKLTVHASDDGLVIPLKQDESSFVQKEIVNALKSVSGKRDKKQ